MKYLAKDENKEIRELAIDGLPPEEKVKFFSQDKQEVPKIQKFKQEELFKTINNFMLSQSNKEEYNWGNFQKFLKLNQQPKNVQSFINQFNKNGKVLKTDLLNLEDKISKKIYGVSYSKYSGIQTLFDKEVKVIQLNLSQDLIKELQDEPEFYDFFKKVSDTSFQSNHPVIKNMTVAWMRYYPDKHGKFWIIEEVQTDIFYAIKHKSVLDDVFGGDKNKQLDFLRKADEFFGEWERALLVHLKHMAIQQGIRHIFMVSDVIKQRTADLSGKAKLKTIYEKLPLEHGFRKLTYEQVKKMKDFGQIISLSMEPDEYIWYSATNRIKEVKENKKLFINNMIKEDKINNKQKLLGLVQLMKPKDIMKVLSSDFGLHKKDAKKFTVGLVSKSKNEMDANNSDDKNWYTTKRGVSSYPPPDDKPQRVVFKSFTKMRDNKENNKNKKQLSEIPAGKTDMTPRFNIKRREFPPDPRSLPDEWPYNDMNVAGMDPKNKGKKRPLMQGKNPLIPDLRKHQRGGDTWGGSGNITGKFGSHSSDNHMSVGSVVSTVGDPGWSRSPPGKEFDSPNDKVETKKERKKKIYKYVLKDVEDDKPNFMKDPPVGCSTANLGNGRKKSRKKNGIQEKIIK